MTELDIVIPVYNEGESIVQVLESLYAGVKTPFRILVCYDRDDDNTLPFLAPYQDREFPVLTVKNRGVGAHGAITTGFQDSTAPAVLVFPADDLHNAGVIDRMVALFREGCDIVAASRFMPGGKMEGCPLLKSTLVRASSFTLHHLARVPSRDASNGFRLFSRRVLDTIPIESDQGFIYSIELLVKCHRLRWGIGEVPAVWIERTSGKSRFRILKWLPGYLRWYFYGYATTYLRLSPGRVRRSAIEWAAVTDSGVTERQAIHK